LRLIAGYMRPDRGSIAVDGQVLSSPDNVVPPENRGMGMVFQNYAVWPHKSVFENVAFGLKVRRKPASEIQSDVTRILGLVGLEGYDHRMPSELSGGQQQRVALARSLVVTPRILLLDEPLSNLDAKLRERMRSELKQLQRQTGITFVYVTHDQAEAMALSDDIAVMDGGVLQQFGPPREIYARPANRKVADFMGQVNFIPGRVVAVHGNAAAIAIAGGETLDVDDAPGLVMDDRVDVAVRPENIRLSPASQKPILRGQVAEVTFLGNLNEYVVTAATDLRLRVQTHSSAVYETGAAVGIAFDAAQCRVFRTEPGA
jgi:iron(III) transport system ATP-binding protein